jgi:hypothetical protein
LLTRFTAACDVHVSVPLWIQAILQRSALSAAPDQAASPSLHSPSGCWKPLPSSYHMWIACCEAEGPARRPVCAHAPITHTPCLAVQAQSNLLGLNINGGGGNTSEIRREPSACAPRRTQLLSPRSKLEQRAVAAEALLERQKGCTPGCTRRTQIRLLNTRGRTPGKRGSVPLPLRRCCLAVRLRRASSPSTFLPYESVLGTMLHELCHNVRGPHDK